MCKGLEIVLESKKKKKERERVNASVDTLAKYPGSSAVAVVGSRSRHSPMAKSAPSPQCGDSRSCSVARCSFVRGNKSPWSLIS